MSLQCVIKMTIAEVSTVQLAWRLKLGIYSSIAFYFCWFLFWKSRSFFCMIGLAVQSVVLSKQRQACGCCSALQATIQLLWRMKWHGCILTPKTTVKSPKATQNIVQPMLKVPGCIEYLNVLCLYDKTEIIQWICSSKNTAIDKNLNRSGKE